MLQPGSGACSDFRNRFFGTCLEARTGKTLSTGRQLGPVYSSPVAVGDRIYFFEDSGACTIIRNGSDFQVLAKNELGETVQTTPAVCNGSLYVRTESNLVRIGSTNACETQDTIAGPKMP